MRVLSRCRSLLLGIVLASVLAGTPATLSAQNTGAPEALVEFMNDMKLGVQVLGGVEQHYQDVLPIKNRSLEYLQRPVQGELSYATPYYGAGLTLRVRGVEMALAVRLGPSSSQSFQFQDGTSAFPYTVRAYGGWKIRAEYFVRDWIGLGMAYGNSGFSIESREAFRLDGKIVRPSTFLFSASLGRTTYALYVPLRREWGPVRIFGRVGAALGNGEDRYYTDYVIYQSPENPDEPSFEPEEAPRAFFDATSATMNAQFGRVGVEVPVWQVTIRPSLEVERLHVPDRTTAWSYDVRLEVGLPF